MLVGEDAKPVGQSEDHTARLCGGIRGSAPQRAKKRYRGSLSSGARMVLELIA